MSKVLVAHNWRGPTGIGVTRAVWRTLGNQNAEKLLNGAFPTVRLAPRNATQRTKNKRVVGLWAYSGGAWPLSDRDYPSGEIVLGVEVRQNSVKASLVDTGCGEFVRPGVVKTVEEDSLDGLLHAMSKVLVAHNWRGPTGISVTRAVWRTLGNQNAEKVLNGAFPNVRGKVAMMIHTEAAAYAEMLCGAAKEEDGRVLVFTLGKNIGAVVYEDGQKLRSLDVSHLIWNWELELENLRLRHSFSGLSPAPPSKKAGKYEPPSEAWLAWIEVLSQYVDKISQHVKPATVVVMPTGAIVKQPMSIFLEHLSSNLSWDAKIIAGARPEGAMIRGAAIGAFKELKTLQATHQLKNCILEHYKCGTKLHHISNDHLLEIFEILDTNKDGLLTHAELKENANKIGLMCSNAELLGLMNYLCQNDQGNVEFRDFCTWWKNVQLSESVKHVMSAMELSIAVSDSENMSVLLIGGKNCEACKKLIKPFSHLAVKFPNMSFMRMDMDCNRSTWKFCKENNIQFTPSFIFYMGEEILDVIDTTQPAILEEHLETLINKNIENPSGDRGLLGSS